MNWLTLTNTIDYTHMIQNIVLSTKCKKQSVFFVLFVSVFVVIRCFLRYLTRQSKTLLKKGIWYTDMYQTDSSEQNETVFVHILVNC